MSGPRTARLAAQLDLSDDEDSLLHDPALTKFETALIMLGVDRDFLAQCERGMHSFGDRTDLKARMMDLARRSIARSERIIAAYRAGEKIDHL